MTTHSSAESFDPQLADRNTATADAAGRSARQVAHDALDALSGTAHRVKDKAGATLERVRPQLDSVAAYAKDEPTKALLIAAAVGAGVIGLITLVNRSGSRGNRAPSGRHLRRAASATADDWRQAAAARADDWRKAATQATDNASAQADAALDSVRNAAQTAYDSLGETVQQWRDQAAGLAERVRPQLETVTNYTREDPAKALLIAAAAGAALMGLVSTIGRR